LPVDKVICYSVPVLKKIKLNKTKFFKIQVSAVLLSIILVLCLGGIFIWKNSKKAPVSNQKIEANDLSDKSAEKSNVLAEPSKDKTKAAAASVTKSAPATAKVQINTKSNTNRTVYKPQYKAAAPAPGISTLAGAQAYIEGTIIAMVNAERTKKGLVRLTPVAQLNQASDIRANEEAIISFVGSDHTRPNGTSYSTVYAQVGYSGCTLWGENLVNGYQSPITFNTTQLYALATKMFNLWKNSPGHYANIVKAGYNKTGVGVVLKNQNGRLYYFAIQEFAKR